MKKSLRLLSLVLVFTMVMGTAVFAANGDILTKDGKFAHTSKQAALDKKIGKEISLNPTKYLYEFNDANYKMTDYFDAYAENEESLDGLTEKLEKDYTPVVEEELKVESISAINANQISVTFEGMEPVKVTLETPLVHGQTEVTFTYEKAEYTAELKEAWVDPEVDYEELKAEIEEKVVAYEAATEDLSTQELIDAANQAKAVINLEGLKEEDKASFQTRIDAADAKVEAAEEAINSDEKLKEKVEEIEGLIAALPDAEEVNKENVEDVKVQTQEIEVLLTALLDEFEDYSSEDLEGYDKYIAVGEKIHEIENPVVVKSVSNIADVTVDFGTLVEELGLPETVEVTLSNETTDTANIEWNTENYDVEKEGEQVLEGTLVVPEGKEWTIPEDKLAVTVKVIVGEDTRVEVKEVVALNAIRVQLVEIPAEVKEENLKDAKITLTAGEVELTAIYAAGSYAKGKAVFNIDDSKKLEDAVTYTVSADWAKFATETFVAKIAKPYAKTFEAVTKEIASNVKADGTKDHDAKIVFTAKDQYGETIEIKTLTSAMDIKATLNGMPLTATEAKIEDTAKNTVVIDTLLKEDDKLVVTIENIVDKKVIGTSTFEYVIGKAQAAVPTTILGVKATKAGKDAKEVLANAEYTLVADVRDQFNSPINANLRWVVVEGKELLDISTENSNGLGSDKTIDNTTLNNKATIKILKPGTLTIDVYNVANSAKYTYTVEIGATALDTLTFTEDGAIKTGNNNEEIIVSTVTANPGAALTPEMIKFEIKATKTDVDITADDIEVRAALRKDINKNATKENANDIVVVAKTSKVGKYSITPYVEGEKKPVKASPLTLETELNDLAISIDTMEVPTLKVGTPVDVQIVVRNKHGEDITAEVKDKVKHAIYKDGKKIDTGLTVGTETKTVTYDSKNKVHNVKFTANTEGKYTVRFTVEGTAVIYEVPVTAEKTKLVSIDLGLDIYDGVVAGDTDVVYRVITALDNKGDKIIPDKTSWEAEAKLGDTTVTDAVSVEYVTKNKTTGKWEKANDKVNAEEIALKINPSKFVKTDKEFYAEDTVVTVTVNNGETDATKKIESELSLTVKAARELAKITLEPTQNKLAVDATATIIIKPVDQYDKFIALEDSENFDIESINKEIAEPVKETGETETAVKVEPYPEAGDKQVGYKFEVKAKNEGTTTVTVEKGSIKATTNVTVEKAEAGLVDKVELVSKKMNADGTYMFPLYGGKDTDTDKGTAVFAVKAYDANGNPVSINDNDIMFTSSNESVAKAKVENKKVTVTAVGVLEEGKDAPVTITVRVLGVSTSIDLVVSDAPAKLNLSTLVALDADEEEADLSNIEVKVTNDVKITFAGIDQYGNPITNVGAYVKVEDLNSSVATGSISNNVLTIKAANEAAEGTATINILNKDNLEELFTITVKVVKAEEPEAEVEKQEDTTDSAAEAEEPIKEVEKQEDTADSAAETEEAEEQEDTTDSAAETEEAEEQEDTTDSAAETEEPIAE